MLRVMATLCANGMHCPNPDQENSVTVNDPALTGTT